MEHKPTDEQVAVVDKFRTTGDNILINSPAGGGKTTLMEMLIKQCNTSALYLAFNTAVVKEASKRITKGGVTIKTFNSMGLGIWARSTGKNITMEIADGKRPGKTQRILKAHLDTLGRKDREEVGDEYFDITAAVAMAKHLGYIPDGAFKHARRLCTQEQLCNRLENRLSSLALQIVDDILIDSIKASFAGSLDFDDQIYMPSLFGGAFPRYPNVFVDEDQDSSPTMLALLDYLAKGRLCAVGDRWQSIYAFRGADTNGIDKIKDKFKMNEMILSYSFRCPETIVKSVHWRVPHMKWIKDGGTHEVLSTLDTNDIPEHAAIICRNNAPLLRAAFGLLSRKRTVSIAGSDVGPRIVRLLQKIGDPRDSSEDVLFKIDAWLENQLQRTNSPQTIHDTAECMRIFATWGENLGQAIAYAQAIFKSQGSIQLTTGHKAKGREWDTVYHLDPWLIGKDDQELNLRYVISTRAAQSLYEITTRELQWLSARQD